MEVVVNDNLSWRMLLIVSPGLTFRTALPRVTIIATPLVVLLQFLLRTRRAHVSRIEKGSLPYPGHTIGILGNVEGLALLGPTHAHSSSSCTSW